MPLDRRHEQKLWDAFRKPIDDAFNRKTLEREKADAALGERDRLVLDAAKALEAANQSGDAQRIRSAMNALDTALRGQAQAKAAMQVAATEVDTAVAAVQSGQTAINVPDSATDVADGDTSDESGVAAEPVAQPAPAPKPVAKPVIAVRGDDRPGMRKTEPAPAGRGPRFGERKDAGRDGARDKPRGPRDDKFAPRMDDRAPRRDGHDGSGGAWQDAPRLGDTAFRAQRDAVEHAQFALKKLAAQAHGEALTQLLTAWEQRDAAQVPSVQELGSRVAPAIRSAWVKALTQAPADAGAVALLRLEMASELPTPAEHLDARRALQLQLLTRRNDPAPVQTWGQDTAGVLSGTFDAVQARRLQNVLKVLLKP